LIEAWHQVHEAKPDAVLVVVGSGPEENSVRERIGQLKLESSILMLGRQPHDKMPQFLQAVDLLCLPSLREGCPNIVLEALSSGAAVVGSAVGAVPELVGNDRGLVVPPRNSDALGLALIQALDTHWPQEPWRWMSWHDNALKVIEAYREALRTV